MVITEKANTISLKQMELRKSRRIAAGSTDDYHLVNMIYFV